GKILNEGKANPECSGMGTTLSLLWFIGSTAFIAQIGDSRIYLYRDKELYLLTEDHSLFFELIRHGSLSLSDYQKFPYKNVITKALGVNLSTEADIIELDILHNDMFILSTDGMHSLLHTDDIKEALIMPDLNSAAKSMIDKANALGGNDNITVVIAEVPGNHDIPNSEEIRERYEVVSKVPAYRTLSLPERIKVLGMSDVLKLRKGDVLFKEGEEGDGLYVVCDGCISVWRGKNPIARFTENTHFGEMSLIEPAMRLAHAVADTESTVLLLKRRDFFRLLKEAPSLAVKLLWNLSTILTSRLKTINDELMLLKACFDSGEIRIAGMPDHNDDK
ncbi:MAG: cyclic nucleotide-binding domain-containing protein, partial [Deltaproteobacteria bacterium]|nr:cyclic nucleotide-binding domain-containing protein [Deltaproteobacteria bacterium]